MEKKLRADHDPEFERLVAEEDLILAVTDALTEALDEAHLSQADLAERLNLSAPRISQIFGGGNNLTLRTISNIANVLSLRPTFTLIPVPPLVNSEMEMKNLGKHTMLPTEKNTKPNLCGVLAA